MNYGFLLILNCCFYFQDVKVDAVTARLTDTKGYTGSHKERFNEGGKGKGISGRKDIVEDTGYVTGYKHQGTYDGEEEEEGAAAAGQGASK